MNGNSDDKKPIAVTVEYCSVCDYGGKCLHLAKMLKETTPDAHVICKKGKQGSFEVYVNEVLIYSKLQTMALPDYNEVVSVVKSVSEGGPIVPIKNQQPIECVIS